MDPLAPGQSHLSFLLVPIFHVGPAPRVFHPMSRLCEPALFSAGVAISPFFPPGPHIPRGVRIRPLHGSTTSPAGIANLQCFPQVWLSRLSLHLAPIFHVGPAPRVFHPMSRLCEPAVFSAGVAISPFFPPGPMSHV
jgi:hypothetical protein